MNDGRIMAADLQYYTNAGNAVDESTLVCKNSFVHHSAVCTLLVSVPTEYIDFSYFFR